MKIILMNSKGDTVIAETDVVEEAEKILREYQQKGCAVLTETGDEIILKDPLPEEIFILWPILGG